MSELVKMQKDIRLYLLPAAPYCDSRLRSGHTVPNADKLSINVPHTGRNRSPDNFLDLFIDESGGEWLEGFV